MYCELKCQCTMSIVRRPIISEVIVLVKIFWASHLSTVNALWLINGKPCEKWLFSTHVL
jgi:hypothetical protein